MPFSDREISNHSGRPVHFYEFWWGKTSWFYTSAERDLELDGQVYTAVPIMDEGITVGGTSPGEFRIKLADNLPVVALYRGTPPSENVRVVAIRKHFDDLESTIFFAGKIDNVQRDADKGEATLLCTPGKTRRGGLRLTWSRGCPHVLYDSQCRADREAFAFPVVVAAVTGNGFTVEAAPALGDGVAPVGYFDGGIVAWDADGRGTLEQRAIERGVSETSFLIFGRADGMSVGMSLTLYPGCNRLPTTCNTKFNNLVNYGGITQMPGESPYGVNLF